MSFCTDRSVRKALHETVLKHHARNPDTLVIEELGLRHGTSRVDIAVVNGFLHGYEIKSDADTLERLPAQTEIFSAVFDRMTLVVGERHFGKSMVVIPDWWAVKVYKPGPEGPVFETIRKFQPNVSYDAIALAELLWRDEVVTILQALGVPESELRKPRAYLYSRLADSVDLKELRRLVRVTLKSREGWRGQRPPSLRDDL